MPLIIQDFPSKSKCEPLYMKPTIIALILVLFAVISVFGGQQKSQESLTRISPDKCGLSLELPGQPESTNPPVPEEMRSRIYYMTLHISAGNGFIVVMNHASASIEMPAKSIAEGVIKGLITSPGVSDLQYNTEPSTNTKAPLKGSYKQNNVVLEINGIALSQKTHSWGVVIVYKQTDKISQALAQRILDSIKIDGIPCADLKDQIGLFQSKSTWTKLE
jgi:hypothetical protein